jgi:hypothetical protein
MCGSSFSSCSRSSSEYCCGVAAAGGIRKEFVTPAALVSLPVGVGRHLQEQAQHLLQMFIRVIGLEVPRFVLV